MSYPRCFESKIHFALWIESARMAPPAPGDSYCADCLPSYQAKMIDQGRCNFPDVVFVVPLEEIKKNKDGRAEPHETLLEGHRPAWAVNLMKAGVPDYLVQSRKPKDNKSGKRRNSKS